MCIVAVIISRLKVSKINENYANTSFMCASATKENKCGLWNGFLRFPPVVSPHSQSIAKRPLPKQDAELTMLAFIPLPNTLARPRLDYAMYT